MLRLAVDLAGVECLAGVVCLLWVVAACERVLDGVGFATLVRDGVGLATLVTDW